MTSEDLAEFIGKLLETDAQERTWDAPYVDCEDLRDTCLDGQFDLIRLSERILDFIQKS